MTPAHSSKLSSQTAHGRRPGYRSRCRSCRGLWFVVACLIVLSRTLPAADAVHLGNDASFQVALDQLLSAKPQPTDDPKADRMAVMRWLYELSNSCMCLRRYHDMEIVCKAMVDLSPSYAMNHTNLSVAYGKQGKFPQAIEEAKIAELMAPADSMHAEAVLCSWILLSGNRTEALDRFAAIPVPQNDPDRLQDYLGCKACFYASVGDKAQLTDAITRALAMGHQSLPFFERDIVFDPYRVEAWFIALVGTTLADPKAPAP